jgi:hypothetical protein
MLAFMREEEAAVIIVCVALPIVLVFVYAISRLSFRHKETERRLQLLEEAIRHGLIDREDKQQVLDALRASAPDAHARGHAALGGKPLMMLAWIGLFVGLVLLLSGDRDAFQAGLIVIGVSFGVLSLPIAMRELETRRTAGGPSDAGRAVR